MSNLILPASYRKSRSQKVDPSKFRGYAKHLKCNEPAFWFKKFGKAWFDMTASEVFFEDGQVKLYHKNIDEYRCSSCREYLEGKDLRLVKIIQDDEAESIHRSEHAKVPAGELCELCGERKKP